MEEEIVSQLISTSRVTRLLQFCVSFRTDAGSVLPYVCDKREYPPVVDVGKVVKGPV